MAKGLTRFSGLKYTPPGLAFPMRQKQLKLGELQRLRKEAQALQERIRTVEEQVKALDIVMGLFPIKIDSRKLPPLRKKAKPLLAHGQGVGLIMTVLRRAKEPMTTREIALAIAEREQIETTPDIIKRFRISCVKNLNYLVERGAVERHHSKKTNGDGFWSVRAP